MQKLGCNAELIVDEFGEKLLEELDYTLVLLRMSWHRNMMFCYEAYVKAQHNKKKFY